jgi:hypothetical protein
LNLATNRSHKKSRCWYPKMDKPIKELETVVGYAEAWKFWDYKIEDGVFYLKSQLLKVPVFMATSQEYISHCYCGGWQPSFLSTSEDIHSPHHTCGFYGYKENGMSASHSLLYGSFARVLGRVAFYGTVVECEYGYRAQKMRILDLWLPASALYKHQKPIPDSPLIRGTANLVLQVDRFSLKNSLLNDGRAVWSLRNLKGVETKKLFLRKTSFTDHKLALHSFRHPYPRESSILHGAPINYLVQGI